MQAPHNKRLVAFASLTRTHRPAAGTPAQPLRWTALRRYTGKRRSHDSTKTPLRIATGVLFLLAGANASACRYQPLSLDERVFGGDAVYVVEIEEASPTDEMLVEFAVLLAEDPERRIETVEQLAQLRDRLDASVMINRTLVASVVETLKGDALESVTAKIPGCGGGTAIEGARAVLVRDAWGNWFVDSRTQAAEVAREAIAQQEELASGQVRLELGQDGLWAVPSNKRLDQTQPPAGAAPDQP